MKRLHLASLVLALALAPSVHANFYLHAPSPGTAEGAPGAKVTSITGRQTRTPSGALIDETIVDLQYQANAMCAPHGSFVRIPRVSDLSQSDATLEKREQSKDFFKLMMVAYLNNNTMRVRLWNNASSDPATNCPTVAWVKLYYCNADQSPCTAGQ